MINTKLNKFASTNHLLVQFSDLPLHPTLIKFQENCREESVRIKKNKLMANQMNFYLIKLEDKQINGVELKNVPNEFTFVISIFYIDSEQLAINLPKPTKRTLLLREGLDNQFYFHYQFQNTLSQQQSLIYLCTLSAAIINQAVQKNVEFYDQKTEQIKSVNNQNQVERLWKNTIYQIPGLGKDKCMAIVQKYPTYISLFNDYEGSQQLKNLLVQRGIKQVRLGKILASRIYRCLFGEVADECIFGED